MRILEISNANEFYDMRENWNATLRESPENTVFSTWEWLSTWWKHFPRGKLKVLILENEKEIVGIAPLMCIEHRFLGVSWKKIHFIGSGLSDYCNFIIKSEPRASLEALMGYLNSHSRTWDFLDLSEIPEKSSFLYSLRELSSVFSFKVSSVCPYLNITSSLELFLKTLSRRMRKELGRTQRRLREKHNVRFKVISRVDLVKEAMADFFNLHSRRWESKRVKERESFIPKPLYRSFLNDVAQCFAQKGWLNLSFILVDESPASSFFCFEYDRKLHAYLSGFDPEYSQYGLGHLHIKFLLEYCVSKRLFEFDFLRGAEEYKNRWNTLVRKNVQVRAFKKRPLNALYDWLTGDSPVARKIERYLSALQTWKVVRK